MRTGRIAAKHVKRCDILRMNVRYVLKNNNKLRVRYIRLVQRGRKEKRRGLVRATLSDGKAKDFTINSIS